MHSKYRRGFVDSLGYSVIQFTNSSVVVPSLDYFCTESAKWERNNDSFVAESFQKPKQN